MKYLVIVLSDVMMSEMAGPDCGIEEDDDVVDHQEVSKVIACETTQEVARAVRENPGWSLWEVTPRGIVQRAIVSKMDGRHLYDVEVS